MLAFMHETTRRAGLLIIAPALGFIAVFTFLAATFGYPAVLDLPAGDVLPRLLAGGAPLRAVWALYAALPLGLVSAAWSLRRFGGLPRASAWAGVAAGLAMTAGLARWATLQWALALDWAATQDAGVRAALAERFDLLNLVLGRWVGEFAGEVLLAGWLLGFGLALRPQALGRALLALAGLMLVGAFRNVVPSASHVTDLTNALLPLVLLWLGGRLARAANGGQAQPAPSTASAKRGSSTSAPPGTSTTPGKGAGSGFTLTTVAPDTCAARTAELVMPTENDVPTKTMTSASLSARRAR